MHIITQKLEINAMTSSLMLNGHTPLRRLLLLSVSLIAIAIPGLATAQAQDPSSSPETGQAGQNQADKSQSFAPDFFAEKQCNNAMDMVNQVPGFLFNSGDTSLRGFGGAAGNVLIDGERPTSKNESLGDILYRIPASQVERIDLIIGGAAGIDMQGQARLVNVIRKPGQKAHTTLEIANQFWAHGLSRPYLGLVFAAPKGATSTDLSYEAYSYFNDGVSDGYRLTRYADGSSLRTGVFAANNGVGQDLKLGHSRPLLGGKISLNLNYRPEDEVYKARYVTDTTSIENQDWAGRNGEIGLRYERPLLPKWRIESNMLIRKSTSRIDDRYNDAGDPSRYFEKTQNNEDILAANLFWQPQEGRTFQAGIEQTFNGRLTRSLYTDSGTPVDVPADNIDVHEDRTEYSLLGNMRLTPKLNVEAGLKLENSTIAVKGEARETNLSYTKPRLQVVYTPTPKLKLTWRLENTLAQLDFSDFAASVDLQSTVVKAGNVSLKPTRKWIHSLNVDYSFWEKGNFNVTLERQSLQDVTDFMALVVDGDTYTTRGNIGDGHIDRLDANLTLPLEKLKIKGGEFKTRYTMRESGVIDPITHQERPISNVFARQFSFGFTQNLVQKKIKWGVNYGVNSTRYQYRVFDKLSWKYEPWINAFIEFKLPESVSKATTINVRGMNLGDQNQYFDRTVYQDLRGVSGVKRFEETIMKPRPALMIKLLKEL
jgi:hypothetical protein